MANYDDPIINQSIDLHKENARLRILLDDAEKALEPFASDPIKADPRMMVTTVHLRNARKALSAIKQYKAGE